MPTFAITNLDTYKENLRYVLERCDELLAFSANKAFRKWRFRTYVYSKKALNILCKRPTNGKKTCIGVGDWSNQDGFIKRHPTAPVKKIKRELHRYAKVLSIDEYNTSKSCSKCGNRCEK
eukprot:734236-Hanusia_phi.AAC.1